MGFNLHFVSTPYPEPLEKCSINFTQIIISVRQSAEPMTQLCRLKVNSWDLPFTFMSAPYLIPFERFFSKLHSNNHLSETVCRTHDSARQTQGQGHTSKSWDLPISFVSVPYLLNPLKDFLLNFTQIIILVKQCAVPMT